MTDIREWTINGVVLPSTKPLEGVWPQIVAFWGTWEHGNPSEGAGILEDCREVRHLNVSERCVFVQSTPNCQQEGGFLQYLDGVFCTFAPSLLPLAITLYALWLLYLFIILGLTAEKFFCPNLSAISTSLKLAHNVAGVTFLAFGNGAPDVFSAMAAFSDPRTAGLAIGALFGAGVFVTTVVAGGICLVKPFTVPSRPFLRDVVFYMVAIFLTFYFLYIGRIRLGEALGYLGIYVFYVFVVVISTWIYRRRRNESLASSVRGEPGLSTESDDVMPAMGHSADYGEEYQPLIAYQETTGQILVHSLNPVDYRKWRRKSWYWKLLKVLKIPIEVVLLLTVPVVDPDREDRNWKRPLNCLHLISSPLVCILTLKSGAYGLYRIQDLFPVWAVVALIGVLLALLVFLTTTNEAPPKYFCLESDGLLVWILAGALGLSLVMSFVAVPLQCFHLTQVYGICLILYYLAFLVVALLTEFKVIQLSTT
uniref:Mitochondrial sodium/calcium exchanger protein isoform X2 n=1 Tax=Geotrypetes seraphini TaxID=260995 RepID=A0A6P8S1M7_GEOSA|nr:mitochondrial sodium/calcium exchanger protein isoform X2 [Geotrypetes seraphini]